MIEHEKVVIVRSTDSYAETADGDIVPPNTAEKGTYIPDDEGLLQPVVRGGLTKARRRAELLEIAECPSGTDEVSEEVVDAYSTDSPISSKEPRLDLGKVEAKVDIVPVPRPKTKTTKRRFRDIASRAANDPEEPED